VETEGPQSLIQYSKTLVYPTLKSYRSFNYVEKNNAKALKVTMNILRKRVSS